MKEKSQNFSFIFRLKYHLWHKFKAVVLRPQTIGVVEFIDVNQFLAAGDNVYRCIVIPSVTEDH